MLILGFSGGISLIHEKTRLDAPTTMMHDAAAVLLDDGKVVAAIEEERLNRIKHSNKAPISAMQFCLNDYHVTLDDVDKVAFYGDEKLFNRGLRSYHLLHPEIPELLDLRSLIQQIIAQGVGKLVDKSKMVFVTHHLAHAVSAFYSSGYDSSLIMTADGGGDELHGMIANGTGNSVEILETTPYERSLGQFYLEIIQFLGYGLFDEYKVMGLAPYGDPGKYRPIFKRFYELLPEGKYVIHWENIVLLHGVMTPRRKNEPFTQQHKDIAAALQESLEKIVFHVLAHYQKSTHHSNLCLAGGVAHNCSLNGKILYSGMFQNVFVQPAAHDAGCALGAALYVQNQISPRPHDSQLSHVYWGNDIGNDALILETLNQWRDFITFERIDNVTEHTARLIADGYVIGWIQGRSEFGPRALGNRSILADPRPEKNKDIINEMVKKREAYRPFAPSVIEEAVEDFFEVTPTTKQFPFMVFVLKVKKDKQPLLGAITHVDGTARVHSVSKQTNRIYWDLIHEFGKLTGIPVLLNTSFNNNVEPIVASIQDALVCYLTTKLHYLVAGNYLIKKKDCVSRDYLKMIPTMPLYTNLTYTKKYISGSRLAAVCEIGTNYSERFNQSISEELFRILNEADGKKPLASLFSAHGFDEPQKIDSLINEIINLWSSRLIQLAP